MAKAKPRWVVMSMDGWVLCAKCWHRTVMSAYECLKKRPTNSYKIVNEASPLLGVGANPTEWEAFKAELRRKNNG